MILEKKANVIRYNPKLEELALEQSLSTCNDDSIAFKKGSNMILSCDYEGVSYLVDVSFDTIMKYCKKHHLGFYGSTDYLTGMDIGIVYKRVPK